MLRGFVQIHVCVALAETANLLFGGSNIDLAPRPTRVKDHRNKNGTRALGDDSYLVRVTGLAGATGLFIWEICRGDGGLVLLRSTKGFPTRIEALLNSAQGAAALALETLHQIPLPVG